MMALDASQWSNGVDPLYAAATESLHYYNAGTGKCSQVATTRELEMALRKMGSLRTLTQRISKEFFMVEMGVDVAVTQKSLEASIATFESTLIQLIAGSGPETLPAPTTQAVADRLIAMWDDWHEFKNAVLKECDLDYEEGSCPPPDQEEKGPANQSQGLAPPAGAQPAEHAESGGHRRLVNSSPLIAGVSKIGDALLAKTESATTTMVDETWKLDKEVRGARSSLATSQAMLREKMMKEVLLVSMGQGSSADLQKTVDTFSSGQETLLNGNGANGKDGIGKTEIDSVRIQLEKVNTAWNKFKPSLSSIGAGTTDKVLSDLTNSSSSLEAEIEAAGALYTTVVSTTTKSPIDILFPLPLTGRWNPGRTMKTAALIAQDIINEQQQILPGYEIFNHFRESKCDSDFAIRETLMGFASSDKWVALGGMACDTVCSSLAIISASTFIPTISYGCSGESLSDTTIFPDFLRLGTKTTAKKLVITHFAELFEWKHISVVSGDPGLYRQPAMKLIADLKLEGISAEYSSALDTDWDATKSMVSNLITNKYRQVFFMGSDQFFRKVLCACKVVGMTTGMTWISDDLRRRSWWTVDDPEVMKLDATCTGAVMNEFLAGAINIAGLGAPLDADSDKPLDCFGGHTSRTFRQLVKNGLQSGYSRAHSADDSNVTDTKEERPFDEMIGIVADGTCAVAKAVRYMLDSGYEASQLRTPSSPVYAAMVKYMRTSLNFAGVSGDFEFKGNDKPGYLGIFQVEGNHSVLVGHVDPNGINISTGFHYGLRNESWTAAPPDKVDTEFPWVVIPATFIGVWQCGAIFLGLWRSRQDFKSERGSSGAAEAAKAAAAAADKSADADKNKKEKKSWFGTKKKAEDANLVGNPA